MPTWRNIIPVLIVMAAVTLACRIEPVPVTLTPTSSPTAQEVQTPPPVPAITPDLIATIEAVVQQRLLEAQQSTLLTPEPTATPTSQSTASPTSTAAPAATPLPSPTAPPVPRLVPVSLPTPIPSLLSAPAPVPTTEPSATLVDLIEQVRSSVVRVETNLGTGSGVIFEKSFARGSALVLTNEHVIERAAWVTVIVYDVVPYQATILGLDAFRDLAVLEICCWGNFKAVELATTDRLAPGSEVITMGYPFALKGEATVTRGIVSAVRYEAESGRWVVQTDAPINPGNSGGPMFSLTGEVVGINTYKYQGGTAEGLGFAVSNKTVSEILPALKSGRVSTFAPPTPVPGTATPVPTPSPTATPSPQDRGYYLTINGTPMQADSMSVVTSFGSVRVLPAAADDGSYSFNTVVTLMVVSTQGTSWVWSGVDAQQNRTATVQMSADKVVDVKIGSR